MAMVTSADDEIVVLAELLLFEEFVSVVADEAVAVLVTTVPFAIEGDAFTTSENWADSPFSKVGIEQVTVPPEPPGGVLQEAVGPVFWVRETNVMPAGRMSVNAALWAASGPELLRVTM